MFHAVCTFGWNHIWKAGWSTSITIILVLDWGGIVRTKWHQKGEDKCFFFMEVRGSLVSLWDSRMGSENPSFSRVHGCLCYYYVIEPTQVVIMYWNRKSQNRGPSPPKPDTWDIYKVFCLKDLILSTKKKPCPSHITCWPPKALPGNPSSQKWVLES